MSQPKLPKWTDPMPVATGPRPERDMVNLSSLETPAKRAAFQRMQTEDPGMAEFIARMAKRFGPPELYVDKKTAERLGVKGE